MKKMIEKEIPSLRFEEYFLENEIIVTNFMKIRSIPIRIRLYKISLGLIVQFS